MPEKVVEKTKRPPAQNKPASSQASRDASGQAFATRLQKLCADFDDLRKDGAGIQAYDDVCAKLAQANAEARKKDERASRLEAEVEQMRRDNEAVTRAFENRFKAWDTDQSQRVRDVEELKTLRISSRRYEAKAEEATQSANQLQYEVDSYRNQAKSLEGEVMGLKDKLDLKSIQWRQKSEEVGRYKDMLKVLQDDLGRLVLNPAKARDVFNSLATQIHDLVWSHFNQAIPDPAAPINVAGPLSRIPLVPSESNAARCMRCAFAEAVIAQQLVASIFRDQYLVDDDTQVHLSGLFQSLEWLDKVHPASATVIRCQIAKISEDSGKMQELPTQAANAVREVLRPWLRGDIQRERELTEALRLVFYDALVLWKDLQRTSQRAEAFIELDGPIWDPMADSKPDYDAVPREDGQSEQHPSYAMIHPIAVLFPKIYVGVDDECDASDDEGGDEDVLFHGYALFHTQAAVMAASKEWTQSQPYQRPIRRRTSEHGRRASVLAPKEAAAAAARVNGILPTSPETSYSQRMAASQAPPPGTRARDSALAASSLSSNRSQRSGSGSGVGGGGGGM
ncbi:hypothetical protein B0T10DRAFT_610502 [Thelonectria olida]|uniref:Uncharacterized protein n=1 Tax=Thelonectria olida TaxID=1576542 RepID=A0A9P9AG79_9HYPO|nr:hypothetical protein B0T10DRAFT_610502 [Thelonectria olida]